MCEEKQKITTETNKTASSLPNLPRLPVPSIAKGYDMARKLKKQQPAPAPRRWADEAPQGLASNERPTARPALVEAEIAEPVAADGGAVLARRRVIRRARPAAFNALSPSRVMAAEAYAATFEAVETGGAGGGGAEKVDGGKPSGEGRQFAAMRWVDDLRRMDAAIGADAIRLDARGRAVPARAVVRAIVIGGASASRILDGLGVRRTTQRARAILTGFDDAMGRVAVALGMEMREENRNINGKNR